MVWSNFFAKFLGETIFKNNNIGPRKKASESISFVRLYWSFNLVEEMQFKL
jgi:hypothetical protein